MKTLETIKIENKDMVIYEIDDNPEWITYGWHVDNKWGHYVNITKANPEYCENIKSRQREDFIENCKYTLKHYDK